MRHLLFPRASIQHCEKQSHGAPPHCHASRYLTERGRPLASTCASTSDDRRSFLFYILRPSCSQKTAAKQSVSRPSGGQSMTTTAATKSAAFVLILSILLVVEGVSRCQLYVSTPSGQWGGDHATYPPAVLLAAACGICFYGLFGIAVSFIYLVTGAGSHVVTLVLLACEFPLGWFFFSVNVLSSYPFALVRAAGPMPGFTGRQSNAIIMMGFLGAFGVGVSLLAAHFFFVLQMARFQWGKAEIYTPMYYRARTFFYSTLVILKGTGELALGAIVKSVLGSGRLASPVVSIPFIVNYAGISIADGSLVVLVGLLGIIIAGAKLNSLAIPFAILTFITFVVQLALYDITQIGINGKDPLIVGSILVGATFTMMMTPAYLILEGAQTEIPAGKQMMSLKEVPEARAPV